MDYDLTHKDGKPYVMIPLQEYHAMSKNGQKSTDKKSSSHSSGLPADLIETLKSSDQHPIRVIRKYQKLTQQDLAAKAEISRPFLTEIETGKKNGSLQAIKQIADALDVSIDIITK